MKKNYFLFVIILFFLHIFSCKRPDITPAYLFLSAEDFKDCIDVSNFNNEFDTSYDDNELDVVKKQYFKDVFVSLNGTELGYWQLPCTIPLLPNYSNEDNIRIVPCVRVINTVVTTVQYPFVTPVVYFFEFEREKIFKVPKIEYKYVPSVEFPILETFVQSINFKPIEPDTVSMKIWQDEALEKDIGRIVLKDSVSFFDVGTSYFYLLGKGERQFWEISYKSINGQMTTYLNFQNTISGITYQSMVVLPSTSGVWKHTYIDITDIIRQACDVASQVSVRLGISGNKNNDSFDAEFYFEYVKLITMAAPYY